jgi:hypothetical protein
MRETGVLLLGVGIMALGMRRQPHSAGMKAFMLGNLFVQLGLIATELLGYHDGTITRFWGVAPNLVLNFLLASGFAFFWLRAKFDDRQDMGTIDRSMTES